MLLSETKLRRIINEELTDVIKSSIKELDPDKYYILFVPESLPLEDLEDALLDIRHKYHMIAVQAAGIKLVEIG